MHSSSSRNRMDAGRIRPISYVPRPKEIAMPIMAAQGRNDARTAARMLASAAIRCLESPGSVPSHVTVLNNVYRLLESYRVNTFFGVTAAPDYSTGSTAFSHPPLERNVGAVRNVLREAVKSTFTDRTDDEAISEIEKVIEGVAYPKRGQPSAADKARTVRFFSEVVERL